MKLSLEALKSFAVNAEKNAQSWLKTAAQHEKEVAKYTRFAEENRAAAATEQAKADDYRAAIALLSGAVDSGQRGPLPL